MEDGINPVKDKLRNLARELLVERSRPKDHWEIAILLETSGQVNADLLSRTHSKDIFDLARKTYEVIEEGDFTFKDEELKQKKKRPSFPIRFAKYYLKGLFFAMPMAVQIFAMLFLQYSLWAWMYFTIPEATAIALGTIASFVVTGGFAQIIGRKGLFYIHQDEDILTMKVSYIFLLMGIITVITVGVIFLLVQLLFGFFPGWMTSYILIYYFLLAFLWLGFAILYMKKRTGLCTIIVAIGILVVHIVMIFGGRISIFKGQLIIWAHIVGLLTAIILAYVSGFLILRRRARKSEELFRAKEMPRFSMLIYSVAPYFFYGFLYFLFICLDRLVSWSCHKEVIPYLITFRVPYELGMDWALLSLILAVGALEYSIEEFSQTIIPKQLRSRAENVSRFNAGYIGFYLRNIILFLIVAILSILFVFFGMLLLAKLNQMWGIFYGIEHFFNPITYFVFFFAAVGYVFLVWGLFNSIFFFALSRPNFVLKSIIPALLVNFVVGFILSRLFGYQWAVLGLTVGSVVFMIISTIYAQRVFDSLDYYYYSAY